PCELGNSPCAAAPQCRSFARIAATSITIRGARRLAQGGMQRYFTAAHDKPYRGQPGRRAWLAPLALCLAVGGRAAPELRPAAGPTPGAVAAAVARQQQEASGRRTSAARDHLGVPYRHGGPSPDTGCDCAGPRSYARQQGLGRKQPGSSPATALMGTWIEKK